MNTTCETPWERLRTPETRRVEKHLQEAGFEQVNAYRINSASIRLRVIDSRFEGLSVEKRDDLVEPHLDTLPEETQRHIVTLFTFSPVEIQAGVDSLRVFLLNTEFEKAQPSML